jgi:hypothetical protein
MGICGVSITASYCLRSLTSSAEFNTSHHRQQSFRRQFLICFTESGKDVNSSGTEPPRKHREQSPVSVYPATLCAGQVRQLDTKSVRGNGLSLDFYFEDEDNHEETKTT